MNHKQQLVIESYFRPYGPGRKLVRPVIDAEKKHKEIAKDKGSFYRTEIINIDNNAFTVSIKRGFRHQIRCHLCWIGFPIKNDPLYSHEDKNSNECDLGQRILALRAHVLSFIDPLTGNTEEYRIESLNSSCSMPQQQRQKDLPDPQVK
jgi:23S rRNA pseudouridine1911/1915/1917 synthase